MGMKYFAALTGLRINIERYHPYMISESTRSKAFLIPTAREVTLAEYCAVSSDAITAHRLADYRRRRFSLVLLPNVHVLLEDMLSAVEGEDVSM